MSMQYAMHMQLMCNLLVNTVHAAINVYVCIYANTYMYGACVAYP